MVESNQGLKLETHYLACIRLWGQNWCKDSRTLSKPCCLPWVVASATVFGAVLQLEQ